MTTSKAGKGPLSIHLDDCRPLSELERRILAHCIASGGAEASGCTVSPVGVVAPDSAAARAVYDSLVYGYGMDIFMGFVTGKVGKRKHDAIAEFVDAFATQIEFAVGMKKHGLAKPVKLTISHQ